MGKCNHCGADIDSGAKFCHSCGGKNSEAGQTKSTAEAASDISENLRKFNDTEDSTSEFEQEDIENNKVMAILAYISFLVIIPIVGAPKSKFARFHANQGLTLAIIEVVWGVVSGILITVLYAIFGLLRLGFIASIASALLGLVGLLFFIFSLIGILNVINGKAKKLPVIGNVNLIKID